MVLVLVRAVSYRTPNGGLGTHTCLLEEAGVGLLVGREIRSVDVQAGLKETETTQRGVSDRDRERESSQCRLGPLSREASRQEKRTTGLLRSNVNRFCGG